jgi:glyoxylase-like metal-dependent hydrolase (beta-lactamase superfamily II)
MQILKDVYMIASGQFGLSDALDCHAYLLDGGDEIALLDAGAGRDPQRLIDNLRADGYAARPLTWLLLTHAHADHAGGAQALRALTGARIACSATEGQLLATGAAVDLGLDRAIRSGIYPPDYVYAHTQPDLLLEPDALLRVGRYTLHAILVPGHSPGSLCYLAEGAGQKMLFSGDVVFHGGTIGLGNWPGSSLEDYRRSIARLSGLGVEALFPGHFLWTRCGGQTHLDQAIANLDLAWVPPAWQHQHAHH